MNITANKQKDPIRRRILVGTATLGIIRMEWAQARFGQAIPCNWSASNIMRGYHHEVPLGFLVADAQNIVIDAAYKGGYEWVLLYEDDVVPPMDAYLKLNRYMMKADIPVVSGLYFLKSRPSEPILYRGRGNGCFSKFKMGDKVWVDGVPTGWLLIHNSIFRLMYEESPVYVTGDGVMVRKVFETPAGVFKDPETGGDYVAMGTSDLYWCDRIMKEDVFKRAGWPKFAKKEFPFLCDTSIACTHIDLNTGQHYPLEGFDKCLKNLNT